jgi:hypothetical protein
MGQNPDYGDANGRRADLLVCFMVLIVIVMALAIYLRWH